MAPFRIMSLIKPCRIRLHHASEEVVQDRARCRRRHLAACLGCTNVPRSLAWSEWSCLSVCFGSVSLPEKAFPSPLQVPAAACVRRLARLGVILRGESPSPVDALLRLRHPAHRGGLLSRLRRHGREAVRESSSPLPGPGTRRDRLHRHQPSRSAARSGCRGLPCPGGAR